MEKKYLELNNGEKIAYLEQGSGDKILLLIHGNFSSSVYFEPLLSRLPKNIRVLAPDLRGYGDSTYYRRISTLYDFAEDVALFLQALKIPNAFVLGWSLGGGVALELAAHYPKLVNKLILVNSTTHRGYPIFKKDANNQMLVGQVYESADEMATDPLQVKPLLDAQEKQDFNFISYIYDLTIYTVNKPTEKQNELWVKEALKQRNLADADWALANLNMSSVHNFYNAGQSNIGNVKVPVLHTMSKKDITVPEYMIQENIKALPDSKLVVYENAGHSPFVDVPDEITKDILDFIL